MSELFEITGKVVLITGGASGMGRMLAEGMLRAGAKVYFTSRKAGECEAAAQEMSAIGPCVGISASLDTPEALAELAGNFAAYENVLDVLINNAGRTWGASLESFPAKAWAPVMAVNVQAPFMLVQELLPLLQRAAAKSAANPARIINIGSVGGKVVEPLKAYSYAASKAAIHHLSRVLAADLAGHNITVNAVLPGYFPTKMTAHIRAEEEQASALRERVPLARLGSAEDIVGTCIFLASRAGAYVTGTEMVVDGGISGCR
jgi:NAD(P)-dependent dehydrogenase (short-subunit alcohol dehydrogenase family)